MSSKRRDNFSSMQGLIQTRWMSSHLVAVAKRSPRCFLVLLVFALVAACSSGEVRKVDSQSAAMEGFQSVEDYYVVDCLLPGEVRNMGKMTYLSPRVHVKSTARDCHIRGGEYVVYSRANYQSALRVWQAQADAGNAEAQVVVGEIYERGLGTAPDYKQAAEWYRKAALQGNASAQRHLGYLYEQGLGVEQNMLTALDLYRKSTGDAEDLVLASAAKAKLDKVRTQLTAERQAANAQREALETQIRSLKASLNSANARNSAQQSQNIEALQQLLAQTESNLKEKSARLAQLSGVEIESTSITRGAETFGPAQWSGMNFGRYYALIIALQDYRYWSDLSTPKADAKAIATLLSDKYGFTTQTIVNASTTDILEALSDLQQKVGENDNVLIYFAGHGQVRYPTENEPRGYWLPVNAQKDRTTYWLPNSQINEQIAMLSARSVLVIADSCYAGSLSTDPASILMGGDVDLTRRLVKLGLNRRARYVLSSGGLEPVLDKGGGQHSIFAAALLETLQSDDELLRGIDLLRRVKGKVERQAAKLGFKERPELRPIRAAGHEPGGRFFLVPQQAKTAATLDKKTPVASRQTAP